MPKEGVEPTRAFAQRFLRPSRLPFRHFGMLSYAKAGAIAHLHSTENGIAFVSLRMTDLRLPDCRPCSSLENAPEEAPLLIGWLFFEVHVWRNVLAEAASQLMIRKKSLSDKI